jgi:hypothetical protein
VLQGNEDYGLSSSRAPQHPHAATGGMAVMLCDQKTLSLFEASPQGHSASVLSLHVRVRSHCG